MHKRRTTFPFAPVIFGLILVVNFYVVFAPANSLMNWYHSDDAFYYYKVAQNFSEGHGLSFDQIGRASGFHPLWMLVCIPVFALARFDLVLPLRVLALISILLHAASAVLVFRLAARYVRLEAALLAAAFWGFSVHIFSITAMRGMESAVSAFFILLLLHLVSAYHIPEALSGSGKPSLWIIGLVASLTVFARLDNVFLVAVIGLWLLFNAAPMRYLVIIDLVLSAVFVFVSFFLRIGFTELYAQYLPAVRLTAVLTPLLRVVINYFAGLYGRPAAEHNLRQLIRIPLAVTLGSGMLFACLKLMRAAGLLAGYPRSALVLEWFFALAALLITRSAYRLVSRSGAFLPQSTADTSLKQSWRTWLNAGLAYGTPIALGLALYMGFNRLYFGVFTPVSGQIKHFWGGLITVYGRVVTSIPGFLGMPEDLSGGPWALALLLPERNASGLIRIGLIPEGISSGDLTFFFLLVFSVLAILLIAFNWQHFRMGFDRLALLPLLAGGLIQVIQYNGTQYIHMRPWYWTAQMVAITLLGAVLFSCLLETLSRWKVPARLVFAAVMLLAAGLLVNFSIELFREIPPQVSEGSRERYLEEVIFLEAHTEPGARIGMTGGGVIAYFIDGRTIVNLDGLMNTAEYFQLLKERRAYEYLNRIGLDYVYGSAYMITESDPYAPVFDGRLEVMQTLGSTTLFRYLAGVEGE